MTSSQKHRSSLYESLSPLVGAEEAEAMLAELPGTEGDELVTRQFLRAELAEVRSELRSEIGGLRVELHAGLRQQTVWTVATVFVAMTLLLALSAALH